MGEIAIAFGLDLACRSLGILRKIDRRGGSIMAQFNPPQLDEPQQERLTSSIMPQQEGEERTITADHWTCLRDAALASALRDVSHWIS